MPYLVAGNFGELGQENIAEDTNRRLAFAASMGNLTQALQHKNALDYQNRALALQAQHQQADLALRQQEANWAHEHAQAMLEQQTIPYMQMMKKQIDWQTSQPAPTAERKQQFEMGLANQQALNGDFDNPDHAKSMYDWMTPQQAQVLAGVSQRARQSIESQHTLAQGYADTLNRFNDLNAQINAAQTEDRPDIPWYQSSAKARKAKVDALKAQLAPIQQRAVSVQKSPLITWDDTQRKYVPAVPAPTWTPTSQTGSKGSTPSGTGTNWMPTTGTLGGQQWMKPDLGGADAGGEMSVGQPTSTGTGAGNVGRKYSPFVYQRVYQHMGNGMPLQDALRNAIGEEQSMFGSGPAGDMSP